MKRDLEERTFRFVCRVRRMRSVLSQSREVDQKTLDQAVGSAGSVGANLEEARGAQSRADFHAKVRISLKEARETNYWLRIIAATPGIRSTRFAALIQESNEIVAILTTIAKKTNPH